MKPYTMKYTGFFFSLMAEKEAYNIPLSFGGALGNAHNGKRSYYGRNTLSFLTFAIN